MKKIIITFLLIFLSSVSFAEDRFYIGVEVSNNEYDTGVSAVSGATLDDEDTGYAIVGGFKLADNIDLEFGYRDFGEASLKGDSGDTFTFNGTDYVFTASATIKAEADSFFLGVKPSHNLTDNVQVFGRLGFHAWDSKLSVSSGTSSSDVNEDGTDPYYGVGLSAKFGNGFVAEASYNTYETDDDITSLSGFIGYRFTY
jgi:hypothetical protein